MPLSLVGPGESWTKTWGVSVVERPEEPHLRLFTADDETLWDSRPQLSSEEFALEDVSDEEWDAFFAALAEA